MKLIYPILKRFQFISWLNHSRGDVNVPFHFNVFSFYITQDINQAWGNLEGAEKDLEDWLLTEMRR